MGGDLPRLGSDFFQRVHQCDATHGRRARTISTHPERHLAGIAVDDVDTVEVHTKRLHHELGKRCFVTLAVTVRAGQHRDRSGWIDAHRAHFVQTGPGAQRTGHVRWRDAAGLDVSRDTDPSQLAAGRRLLATCLEIFVVSKLDGLL